MNPDPVIWQHLLMALPAELALVVGTLVDPRPLDPLHFQKAHVLPLEFEFNGWRVVIVGITMVTTGAEPPEFTPAAAEHVEEWERRILTRIRQRQAINDQVKLFKPAEEGGVA